VGRQLGNRREQRCIDGNRQGARYPLPPETPAVDGIAKPCAKPARVIQGRDIEFHAQGNRQRSMARPSGDGFHRLLRLAAAVHSRRFIPLKNLSRPHARPEAGLASGNIPPRQGCEQGNNPNGPPQRPGRALNGKPPRNETRPASKACR